MSRLPSNGRRSSEPSGDSTARHALGRLADLEQMLKGVGLEAASVHQLLQHEHLI
ncbi:MAG: hypothetical protein WCD11_16535 [Solirubrobacteraceae bacterium]